MNQYIITEDGFKELDAYFFEQKDPDVTTMWINLKNKEFQRCNPQAERDKVLDEYNDELLTKLVQELAGTWRMRDAKMFSIIRKYRRVSIGAMKAELRQEGKEGE